MAMSRRDFEAIAASIKDEVSKCNPELEAARLASLKAVAEGVARHSKSTNRSFNRPRFMAAAGFDQFN